MTKVRVAACQYEISFCGDWASYEKKMIHLVQEAVDQDAKLIVFPEYAGLELASILPENVRVMPETQLEGIQSFLPQYWQLFSELAKQHQIYLVPGTVPYRAENGRYFNRAYFFAPSGQFAYQDKLKMTRFEAEEWLMTPGSGLNVFHTAFGKVGIAICYDSEFPVLVRALVQAGARLILVPSCTDGVAGFYRLHLSCRARALENQVYVVQVPLVGKVDWLDAVDESVGKLGFFSPVDQGFPDDGILVQGQWNLPGWVCTELDFAKLETVRTHGMVLNDRDWVSSVIVPDLVFLDRGQGLDEIDN